MLSIYGFDRCDMLVFSFECLPPSILLTSSSSQVPNDGHDRDTENEKHQHKSD